MKQRPDWNVPSNAAELASADEGGIWESDEFAPLILSVMVGTSYGDRDIPVAWQIEFEPEGEVFESANSKIEQLGLDPDGYGWSSLINAIFEQHFPADVNALQFGDTEESACVVWVESEAVCKRLVEVIWSVIFDNEGAGNPVEP